MKKIIITLVCTVAVAAVLLTTLFVMPVLHENDCRNRVFPEMEKDLGKVSGAVIGIIPKTEQSYGAGGSGFVFRKDAGVYYAFTAAHIVSSKSASYKVYSTKTVESRLSGAGAAAGIASVDDSFYEALSDASIEYVSPHADIAIISFKSEEELDCLTFADAEPQKGDKLMCLGMSDDMLLNPTYGTVTAGLKEVSFADKMNTSEKSDNVIEHDAYISNGNSGGPAINEGLTVAGINIGAEFNRFEHFRYGYLIPASQLKECIEAMDKQ